MHNLLYFCNTYTPTPLRAFAYATLASGLLLATSCKKEQIITTDDVVSA